MWCWKIIVLTHAYFAIVKRRLTKQYAKLSERLDELFNRKDIVINHAQKWPRKVSSRSFQSSLICHRLLYEIKLLFLFFFFFNSKERKITFLFSKTAKKGAKFATNKVFLEFHIGIFQHPHAISPSTYTWVKKTDSLFQAALVVVSLRSFGIVMPDQLLRCPSLPAPVFNNSSLHDGLEEAVMPPDVNKACHLQTFLIVARRDSCQPRVLCGFFNVCTSLPNVT